MTEVELGERGTDVAKLVLDAGDELRLVPAVVRRIVRRDAELAVGALLPDAGARRLVDQLAEEDAETSDFARAC